MVLGLVWTAVRRRLGRSLSSRREPIGFFNTQPPEGGWIGGCRYLPRIPGFNTQPPEGGWAVLRLGFRPDIAFQHTAARRRLGCCIRDNPDRCHVSTHSRLKAAGALVSTHRRRSGCFNTQPPEGGWGQPSQRLTPGIVFQHTAA